LRGQRKRSSPATPGRGSPAEVLGERGDLTGPRGASKSDGTGPVCLIVKGNETRYWGVGGKCNCKRRGKEKKRKKNQVFSSISKGLQIGKRKKKREGGINEEEGRERGRNLNTDTLGHEHRIHRDNSRRKGGRKRKRGKSLLFKRKGGGGGFRTQFITRVKGEKRERAPLERGTHPRWFVGWERGRKGKLFVRRGEEKAWAGVLPEGNS